MNTFKGPLTGKRVRYVPPPGKDIKEADIGDYIHQAGRGFMLVRPVEGEPRWHECAAISIREVVGDSPKPTTPSDQAGPGLEPAQAPTTPTAPPVAPGLPTLPPAAPAPVAPPPRNATHARLREANSRGAKAAADHGAQAATEADFVTGVSEERKG